MHNIAVLINRALMSFAFLCMALSLVAKEIEIDKMVLGTPVNQLHTNAIPFYVAILNVVVSILMVIINFFKKLLTFKLSILRLEKKENSPFLSQYTFTKLFLQSIALLLCPVPFLTKNTVCSVNSTIGKPVCYSLNDFFHIF